MQVLKSDPKTMEPLENLGPRVNTHTPQAQPPQPEERGEVQDEEEEEEQEEEIER